MCARVLLYGMSPDRFCIAMSLAWDGADNLTVIEDIHVPVIGTRRYSWIEPRVADEVNDEAS